MTHRQPKREPTIINGVTYWPCKNCGLKPDSDFYEHAGRNAPVTECKECVSKQRALEYKLAMAKIDNGEPEAKVRKMRGERKHLDVGVEYYNDSFHSFVFGV